MPLWHPLSSLWRLPRHRYLHREINKEKKDFIIKNLPLTTMDAIVASIVIVVVVVVGCGGSVTMRVTHLFEAQMPKCRLRVAFHSLVCADNKFLDGSVG